MMRHYYLGKEGDIFCGLCGGKLSKVSCYSGVYDTKTGKKCIDILRVCENKECYGKAPDDLMRIKQ